MELLAVSFCGRTFRRCPVLWAGAVAVAAVTVLVGAEIEEGRPDVSAAAHAQAARGDSTADPSDARRMREGAELVDQVGHFELAGQRLVFVADRGGVRLWALENLNLERVARSLASYPGQLNWKVCGTVTEYRGANYLLLRRAVMTTGSTARSQ